MRRKRPQQRPEFRDRTRPLEQLVERRRARDFEGHEQFDAAVRIALPMRPGQRRRSDQPRAARHGELGHARRRHGRFRRLAIERAAQAPQQVLQGMMIEESHDHEAPRNPQQFRQQALALGGRRQVMR